MDPMVGMGDDQIEPVSVMGLDQQVEQRHGIGTSRHGHDGAYGRQLQAGDVGAKAVNKGHARSVTPRRGQGFAGGTEDLYWWFSI
jgi:hypothetical protein